MKTLFTVAITALLAWGSSAANAQTVVVPAPVPAPVVVPAPVPGGVAVTSSMGVVDVYEPGTRFVVRESTGPVSYTYGPQTVYATPGGVVLTAEQVRTRMRAGLPVRVEYMPQGDTRVIQRVIIREHDDDDDDDDD